MIYCPNHRVMKVTEGKCFRCNCLFKKTFSYSPKIIKRSDTLTVVLYSVYVISISFYLTFTKKL